MKDPELNIKDADEHLATQDLKLGELIKFQTLVVRQPRTDYFHSLCRSIIGQQVSVAAASTIFARFENLTELDPKVVAGLTDEQARSIGLSRQKEGYLKDLASHFVNDPKVYNHLGELEDQEVIAELTEIKGIGVWTAQMFLMFTLGRLDVFAPDDLGLKRAMQKLYGWTHEPSRLEMETKAEEWKPYRTVACWHLWQSLDNAPK